MKNKNRICRNAPIAIYFCLAIVGLPRNAAAQTLTVNANSTVQTLTGTAFGMNLFYWADIHSSLAYFKEAGIKSVRYPGGLSSDVFDWTKTGPNNATESWAQFVADMTSAGIRGKNMILTCNYGKAGTPQMAAEWVRDANITRKLRIKYWELGNEEWNNHDPRSYTNDYIKWSKAMKAVDPTIKLGAISTDQWGDWAGVTNPVTGQTDTKWLPIMLATFRAARVTPDYIIQHEYQYGDVNGAHAENDSKLLSGINDAGETEAEVVAKHDRKWLNDYLPNASGVPVLQTEVGSYYSAVGKQAVNLPCGLGMAIVVGDSINTEFVSTDWWQYQDNYINTDPKQFNMSSDLYGWRIYGHEGIARFDPNNASIIMDRHPTFYITTMLNKFLADGDKVLASTSSEPLLKIYAVKHTDKSLSVLVINTSPNTDYNTIPITLAGYKARGNAAVWTYGKANDDAAKNNLPGQDVTQSSLAVSGSTITMSFPQYSATLMTFGSTSKRH